MGEAEGRRTLRRTMEGVEELPLAAAFERGQAAYHKCETGGADEVRTGRNGGRADGPLLPPPS